MGDPLRHILETSEAERLASGFTFTEGPTWHPDGFYYFVDLRVSRLHRITPGKPPELVRNETGEGNGTTYDLQGHLLLCEGGNACVTRMDALGQVEVLADSYEGKRLNRPNDVVCKSDGSIYFTDPGLRVAFFRPLSSLSHRLDLALWPASPQLMYLHSLAWFGALLAAAESVGAASRMLESGGRRPYNQGRVEPRPGGVS